MNEKLTLQDIIDVLAKKNGLTKKEADLFLRELFDIITQNIFNNELVKIRGFGTFKLTLINSRESINVNTGEKIEIPAHYKFSFLPDKSLKTLINKPFAHFETVLLEDGVTFEALETSELIVEETEEDFINPEEIENNLLEQSAKEDKKEIIASQEEEKHSHPEAEKNIQPQKIIFTEKNIQEQSENITKTEEDHNSESEIEEDITSEELMNPEKTDKVDSFPEYYTEEIKSVSNDEEGIILDTTLSTEETEINLVSEAEKNSTTDESEEVVEISSNASSFSSPYNDTQDDEKLQEEEIDSLNVESEKIMVKTEFANTISEETKEEVAEPSDINNKPDGDYSNNIQEKILRLKEEIEILSKAKTLSDSDKKVPENKEFLNTNYEDITEEILKDERTKDNLLDSLVELDGGSGKTSVKVPLSKNNTESFQDFPEDSSYPLYDYNHKPLSVKIRQNLPIILFLTAVIGFGIYQFSKLLNTSNDYERTYRYTSPDTEETPPFILPENIGNDSIQRTANNGNNRVQDSQKNQSASERVIANIPPQEVKYDKKISDNLKIRILKKAGYQLKKNTGNNT